VFETISKGFEKINMHYAIDFITLNPVHMRMMCYICHNSTKHKWRNGFAENRWKTVRLSRFTWTKYATSLLKTCQI